jgi:hypothetical protein
MSSYPNRCQHLKTNGTQCGSPALRRNRFCYFHKRYQEERIRLTADRRRAPATFFLPVLEDANSIQMSLMQIMRLLLTGQIEHKTASLLLYALQTASTNLRLTRFDPRVHEVILDPREARNSPLDETRLWDDEDFEEEEDEEEIDPVEQEIREKEEEAARKARYVARWEAKKEIEARERGRKRYEEEEKLKVYVQEHPEFMLVRENGRLKLVQRPQSDATEPVGTAAIGCAGEPQLAKPAELCPAGQPKGAVPTQAESSVLTQPEFPVHSQPEEKNAVSDSADEVRERLTAMIREKLPELTEVYNEGMKQEAEELARKKQPQKETIAKGAERKSV